MKGPQRANRYRPGPKRPRALGPLTERALAALREGINTTSALAEALGTDNKGAWLCLKALEWRGLAEQMASSGPPVAFGGGRTPAVWRATPQVPPCP